MNAHQRRIARRKDLRYYGESPSYAALYASDGAPFNDDDWADDDEREECTACRGDGRDPMTDYLLPCEACGGDGYFD